MSGLQETGVLPAAAAGAIPSASAKRPNPALIRFLKFAGSVRLGIILLILLGLASTIGMLVMQQNVDGFPDYYATLTPAQKLVYGRLGLFNIYHSWHFNVILAALSLNIILSTIERIPKIWPYISRPAENVPIRWMRAQKNAAAMRSTLPIEEAGRNLAGAFRAEGFTRVAETIRDGRTFVFAQRGAWNRLAFVAVHVGLLTIFFGGFLTAQLGHTGNLPLAPGQSSDLIFDTAFDLDRVTEVTKKLPFEITFTDIQQKLIREDGPLSAGNTIDWLTSFTIRDETGTHEGFVQMNRPFDYRGYRFFQSSFIPIGKARRIVLEATPDTGGQPHTIEIERNGTAQLPDRTQLIFKDFRGNFRAGLENPNEDTSSYQNPAAILEVKPADGMMQQAILFGAEAKQAPVTQDAVGGYRFRMISYEKVAESHVLSVQRDPGSTVVYAGFAILGLALGSVFFFSHTRVWASIEPSPNGGSEILIAAQSNRNSAALETKFRSIRARIERGIGGAE